MRTPAAPRSRGRRKKILSVEVIAGCEREVRIGCSTGRVFAGCCYVTVLNCGYAALIFYPAQTNYIRLLQYAFGISTAAKIQDVVSRGATQL